MEIQEHLLRIIADQADPVVYLKRNAQSLGIFKDSIFPLEDALCFMIWQDSDSLLVVTGDGPVSQAFEGEGVPGRIKFCRKSPENAQALRHVFPFTAPVSHQGHSKTLGLGDRLGLATPGHLQLIKNYSVFPVLAQQSIRELNLTGRTYGEVLDDVTWPVYREGYTRGYGADGDHLKTEAEVRMALDLGYTMITLDCSEHIRNEGALMSPEDLAAAYGSLSASFRSRIEDRYLNKTHVLQSGYTLRFDRETLMRSAVIYGQAIEFAAGLYTRVIAHHPAVVDFEMSIDETLTPTAPTAHYFTADLLLQTGVHIISLAPRFCGEFQKGIDYIGDIHAFSEELSLHSAIARHFGYKISVHSGSDKFSVFPIVNEKTEGFWHVKTAGTNWLEAVRTLARKDPKLYREMHAFALEHLEEARKYYHIGAKPENIKDICTLSDDMLPALMDENDARQVLHITYGLLLNAREDTGNLRFKDRIYALLKCHGEDYANALHAHIGRHLNALGLWRSAPL